MQRGVADRYIAGRERCRCGGAFGYALALCFGGLVGYRRSRISQAVTDERQAISILEGEHDAVARAYATAVLAHALIDSGDLELAADQLDALALTDPPQLAPYAIAVAARGRLRLLQGDPEGALSDQLRVESLAGMERLSPRRRVMAQPGRTCPHGTRSPTRSRATRRGRCRRHRATRTTGRTTTKHRRRCRAAQGPNRPRIASRSCRREPRASHRPRKPTGTARSCRAGRIRRTSTTKTPIRRRSAHTNGASRRGTSRQRHTQPRERASPQHGPDPGVTQTRSGPLRTVPPPGVDERRSIDRATQWAVRRRQPPLRESGWLSAGCSPTGSFVVLASPGTTSEETRGRGRRAGRPAWLSPTLAAFRDLRESASRTVDPG